MVFEKIVVPLDGSQLGETALPWAADIAAAFRSQVHLLSVAESTSAEDHGLRQGYLDHRAELLKREINLRNAAVTADVVSAVASGDPAHEVVRYTETNGVGLLILVSHGRSGILSWPMGSTAARILGSETCPVLFVRARTPTPGTPPPAGGILVPLDGSSNAETVLPYAREICTRLQSPVTLLRTVPVSHDVVTIGGARTVDLAPREVARLSHEAEQYLSSVRTSHFAGQVTASVRTGNAAAEITRYATERAVSLIAISSRGQSQTSGWKLGEVSHKILHTAGAPIFMIRIPPSHPLAAPGHRSPGRLS
jgi:nucleotide-binding universal stress UspA family protein